MSKEEHVARWLARKAAKTKWKDVSPADKKLMLMIARHAVAAMEDYDG